LGDQRSTLRAPPSDGKAHVLSTGNPRPDDTKRRLGFTYDEDEEKA
jgi:hypothetical protein